MKKVLYSLLLGIGGVALLATLLLTIYFTSTGGIGLPVRFELPPGYKGWLVLKSDDPACKPYQQQGMWLTVQVGNDGSACVSDHRDPKWHFTHFVYLHPDGSTTKVQEVRGERAHYSSAKEILDGVTYYYSRSDDVVDAYFVGSEAELKQSPSPFRR